MNSEIENLLEEIDSEEDVGQKRYLMNLVFEKVLETVYGGDLPEPQDTISELAEGNGYIYKLAQDFLTESSTMKKERKLRKMVDYIER